ncbi:MAG: TonB-dependent receptor [Flavobacteriales bacterium]|nr:TonB-dependent receptor [Flavobacteriales bacterium]
MRSKFGLLIILLGWLSYQGMAQADFALPNRLHQKSLAELALWVNDSSSLRLYLDPSLLEVQVSFESGQTPTLLSVLKSTARKSGFHVHTDERGFVYLSGTALIPGLPKELFTPLGTELPTDESDRSGYLGTLNSRGGRVVIAGNANAGAYIDEVTISGTVRDGTNGLPIFGATLLVNETSTGASTDEDGGYELKLPKGKYSVTVRTLEMDPLEITLIAHSDDEIDLEMTGKIFGLREVVISAEARSNVERPEMGVEKLSVNAVNSIPRMMGEPDIVKAALLLPGVQSVAEGTGQLNVRGAPSDQNIFYLDDIPVYNTTHLMGFFSAFTPNALSDVSIYKSSLPSRYGGRLSSVFDIGTSSGNKEKFKLKGGISPITADIQMEGPALNKKLTYMTAFRSTYSNWVLDLIDVPKINGSNGSFQDAIVRLNYDINDKNTLSSTGYFSNDKVQLSGLSAFAYSNSGASLRWTHSIRYKHSFSISTAVGRYAFTEENVQTSSQHFKTDYQIEHAEARAELVLRPASKHTIKVGLNSTHYGLDLGNVLPFGEESLIKPIDLGVEQGLESGIYAEEQWTVGPRLTIKGGVRINMYQYLGPNTVYTYADPTDPSLSTIIDTLSFGKYKVISTSVDPDIRLSAKYSINELLSVKASVNRAHQYINILSNTVTVTPSARWKLADRNIQPMEGWHYSVGVFKNIREMAEVSVEIYYKQVQQLLDYRDGADLVFAERPEVEVLQGDLAAYGIEVMFKKSVGKLKGWFNYTYARSFVQVTGINDGITYPSNFDKPHSVNLSVMYQHTTRMSFSANIVYASGRPITFPTSVFYQSEFPLTYYSTRNEFRIPDYFRCDVGMSLEGSLKAKKKLHGTWHFSVYNLFGRHNPFTVYAVPEDGLINGYQLSIFGSPIPSIAYQFKLGNYAR